MPRPLQGACFCGATRYSVPDDFAYALICHCSRCRRATGAAAKPFAGIRAEAVALDPPGAPLLRVGAPDGPHDLHCPTCGSLLWSVVRDGAWAHVTLGTLRDEPSLRPTAHIFVASKAGWDTLPDDGLPRWDGFPE